VPRVNKQGDMRNRFISTQTRYSDFMARKDSRAAKFNDWDRVQNYKRPGQDSFGAWQDKPKSKVVYLDPQAPTHPKHTKGEDYWGRNLKTAGHSEPTKRFKSRDFNFGESMKENSQGKVKVFEPVVRTVKQTTYDPRVDLQMDSKTSSPNDKAKKQSRKREQQFSPSEKVSIEGKRKAHSNVRYEEQADSSESSDSNILFASFAKSASKKIQAMKSSAKN